MLFRSMVFENEVGNCSQEELDKFVVLASRGGGKGGRGGAPAPPELSNFFNYIT